MEDLIMKIIDIEDRAQEVIRDAKKADMELDDRVKNESQKLREDIEKKVEEKNVTVKHIEEEEADKKIEQINADTEKHLSELSEKYESNKDKWVKNIVSDIIGR